jgi:hypothetical protein
VCKKRIFEPLTRSACRTRLRLKPFCCPFKNGTSIRTRTTANSVPGMNFTGTPFLNSVSWFSFPVFSELRNGSCRDGNRGSRRFGALSGTPWNGCGSRQISHPCPRLRSGRVCHLVPPNPAPNWRIRPFSPMAATVINAMREQNTTEEKKKIKRSGVISGKGQGRPVAGRCRFRGDPVRGIFPDSRTRILRRIGPRRACLGHREHAPGPSRRSRSCW